ncbi:MAG: hypothetical protein KIT33_15470 [Candidatus Kapabacteria bacterium]|nr:hypothetical protein [Ignavibacteriota bacterium]MCW5886369.1 hypothetical protein [Candidatus Kapabacteria bacterium]
MIRLMIMIFAVFNLIFGFAYSLDKKIIDSEDYLNITFGNDLSFNPGLFGFSDSWFVRGLIFRKSPYNAFQVKYNGVLLNSVTDGSMRGDLLVIPYHKSNYVISEPDILSNSESLAGYLNINRKNADSTSVTALIEGGNVFGGASANISGKKNYLKWSSGVSYITSAGFDVSADKPDTIGFARTNTGFDKISGNARLNISDSKSSLDAEFIYSQSTQSLPFDLYPEANIFLKEPDFKLNLFNLMFETSVSQGLVLRGNLFYLRTKSILEKYDDSFLINKQLQSSFTKTFEENRFGLNSVLQFDIPNIPPGELSLNYSRESLKYQPDNGLIVNRYEIEKLNFGFKLSEEFDLWEYKLLASYRILNPLTAYQDQIIEGFSNIDYSFDFGIKLTDYLKINGDLTRSSMLPHLYLIYPEINESQLFPGIAETTINQTVEIGINLLILKRILIDLKYFNSNFSNIQVPFDISGSISREIPNSMNVHGLSFSRYADIYLAYMQLDAVYFLESQSIFDQFGREIIIPEISVKSQIYNSYDFGLSWLVESIFVSGRESSLPESRSPVDFWIFNAKLSQKVFQNNEVYLRLNNLTDVYYEYIQGMPMPGIYFIAGIKLIL